MALRNPYNPFVTILGPSTPEQRKEALDNTRETLTQLRDMLRDLDIPAANLGLAKEIFSSNLGGIMAAADDARMKERAKAKREKIKAQMAAGQGAQPLGYQGLGQPPTSLGYPGVLGGYFDDLDDDD